MTAPLQRSKLKRVSVYRDKPVATFSIIYTSGLTNTSIPGTSSQTLSSFPSFVIEDMANPADMNRGYLTWFRGRKYSYGIEHTCI